MDHIWQWYKKLTKNNKTFVLKVNSNIFSIFAFYNNTHETKSYLNWINKNKIAKNETYTFQHSK